MISDKQVTSKQKYKNLKRKLKLLLYEQECFLDELRKSERKMIKVQRDKNFLLDRLLQYERVEDSSGDSDSTMSSNESDSEIPSNSHQNSRTASATKQERGSPAAATPFGGGHFTFPVGQPSMDLSPTGNMLSNSLPGGMFGMMHQQAQLAPNASLNGPGVGGQRLVAGSPAVTRGRGRPRAGGQGGVTRGGGGGRGTRGRGGGAGSQGISSSSAPSSSNSGGLTGLPSTSTLTQQQQQQGTPSRGNSSNGNYATSSCQPPQLNTSVPLVGSPNQPPGVMGPGDMGSSVQFAMYQPDGSGAAFMQQPPQPQSQRYTPQPPTQIGGGPQINQQQQQPQPSAGSMTPTGQQQQQNMMQYSQAQQQTPQQQQPNVVLMGPPQSQQQFMQQPPMGLSTDILLESVMTHEDVERCLESSAGPDRYLLERISGDLPADIFSENSEDGGMGNSVSSEA